MASMFDTRLTPELKELAENLLRTATEAGLDVFPTVFELVDYKQLSEIAAYGGFPTRYPHWRWGMEYERISKSYTYGLSIIYEMVINNNPCYAYLLRGNSLVYQKTVIAHVYGHCDFFKNNYWFSKTNRKMLDQMANHSSQVQKIINEIGHEEVEEFVDVCLSLENLIDIHAPFKFASEKKAEETLEDFREKPVAKFVAKNYMDTYINPAEYMEQQKKAQSEKKVQEQKFPATSQRDVLQFLLENAPLNIWKRRILEIIRNEAYYFAPQGQTKILNEGWATYWHSKMMTALAPVCADEIIDYCDHYAGVVASHPGQVNPYKLGVELLRHIEKRWNKGQFGLEYMSIDDPKIRKAWNKDVGLGKQKLFEVRKIHNDVTFLDEFLDEDFCHEQKMFIYDYDKQSGKYFISGKDFREIKSRLLDQLTNFSNPIIKVVDGNYKNRGELLLEHDYQAMGLKKDYAIETLKNLFKVWGRPVHVLTIQDKSPVKISFDGSSHLVEKI